LRDTATELHTTSHSSSTCSMRYLPNTMRSAGSGGTPASWGCARESDASVGCARARQTTSEYRSSLKDLWYYYYFLHTHDNNNHHHHHKHNDNKRAGDREHETLRD